MTTNANCQPLIAIIGGGPAGMSCALWLKQMGFSPCIIEHNAKLGGQLLNINRINRWVLGFPNLSSIELAKLYAGHILEENIQVNYKAELTSIIMSATGHFQLVMQDPFQHKTTLQAQAIVIAAGVRVRGSEIFNNLAGMDTLVENGLICFFPTDHVDKLVSLRNKTVIVIGGGDNAHFTIKDIAKVAAHSYLLMRSHPKAQSRLRLDVENLISQGLVSEHQYSTIESIYPSQQRISLALKTSTADTVNIQADIVFTRAGFAPNSEFLENLAALAGINKLSTGYLATDSSLRTSIRGVYAIGDIANPGLQSVVSAIADGAKAARTITEDLAIRDGF